MRWGPLSVLLLFWIAIPTPLTCWDELEDQAEHHGCRGACEQAGRQVVSNAKDERSQGKSVPSIAPQGQMADTAGVLAMSGFWGLGATVRACSDPAACLTRIAMLNR